MLVNRLAAPRPTPRRDRPMAAQHPHSGPPNRENCNAQLGATAPARSCHDGHETLNQRSRFALRAARSSATRLFRRAAMAVGMLRGHVDWGQGVDRPNEVRLSQSAIADLAPPPRRMVKRLGTSAHSEHRLSLPGNSRVVCCDNCTTSSPHVRGWLGAALETINRADIIKKDLGYWPCGPVLRVKGAAARSIKQRWNGQHEFAQRTARFDS